MISIIIIVKNDRRIEKLLAKLNRIKKKGKLEVVVIDASEGGLDNIKKKFPLTKWFYFKNKQTNKITIPEQRNMGLQKAKGDIIVFIDADCIPTNNWLIELIKPLKEEGESIVAGLVKSTERESINNVAWEKRCNKRYIAECGMANIAFKKGVLKKVGYFDENLEGGEDIDFTWRAVDSNYNIRYNKKAIIYHDWGDFNNGIRREIMRGATAVRLFKKHPHNLKKLFENCLDILVYPIYILFSPIIFFWPYYLMLLLIPLTRNLLNKSLRKKPLEKIFMDLVRGWGVLKELFFPKIYKYGINKK